MVVIIAVVATLTGCGLGVSLARIAVQRRVGRMWRSLAAIASSKNGDVTVYEMADVVEAYVGKGR